VHREHVRVCDVSDVDVLERGATIAHSERQAAVLHSVVQVNALHD
jgi:hypothetical protein